MQLPPALASFLEPWLLFLADDPLLRMMQIGMLLLGSVVIFLVFYTTRDILLRTHSFFYMFFSIVLVAALPVLGFFLYLLIRPARTIKQRETEKMLKQILGRLSSKEKSKPESDAKSDSKKTAGKRSATSKK